jgi:hypothetical protein
MHARDRHTLLDIAERPIQSPDPDPLDPTSPTRMARAAMAVIKHSEEFDLEQEAADTSVPVETYISSLLADLLHFADAVRPGRAKAMLNEAIHYTSETTVYDSLRGLQVQQ